MRPHRLLLVILLVLTALPAAAQEAPEPPEKRELPDGVAAIIRNEIISMDEFRRFLLARFGKTQEGRQALENMVEEILIDSERIRRGVSVSAMTPTISPSDVSHDR